MGGHIHNTLKDFYTKIPTSERNFPSLEKLLRNRWLQNRKGFVDKKEEAQWGVKALTMLRLFAHRIDLQTTPKLFEDYYATIISPELKILGRIDRADELNDDTLHVIDYKTGKFDEKEINDNQLIIYSLIVSANLKQAVTKASYLFLQTCTWHTIELTEEKAKNALSTILEDVEKIHQEKNFLPTPNKHCRTCDFSSICPNNNKI